MQRRLAALLVADAVGSTPAMERDEEAAVAEIGANLELASSAVTERGGRVFSTAGDAIFAEFGSPINALRAALEARARLAARAKDAKAMRFGLHLADVIEVGDDLRGDGVNIAARIQGLAAPGDIVASDALYSQVRRASPCRFDPPSQRRLKGVSEPVVVYRVRAAMDRHPYHADPVKEAPKRSPIRNSVAVLPFRTASSADEDQTFLAEGFSEDLTLELSRIRDLHVIARMVASNLSGRDPVEIGEEVGAAFVISGSVRKIGSQVRLNVSLTGVESGRIIWSDRILVPFEELLDVMDELTLRISSTVLGRIEQAGLDAAKLKRPETMSAYEHYLHGMEHHRLGGVTEQHYRDAVRYFQRSLETDPGYSRAMAMQVCSASNLKEFDIVAGEQMIEEALRHDPDDAEANRIKGSIMIRVHRDFDAAETYFNRSMALAPSNSFIIGRAAAFRIYNGEAEEGLKLLDRAEAMDPFLPVTVQEDRVAGYYALGRHDDMFKAAKALPYQTRRSRIYRTAVRVERGEVDRGRQLIAAALADDPSMSSFYIRTQELYRDESVTERLVQLCEAAGLPPEP